MLGLVLFGILLFVFLVTMVTYSIRNSIEKIVCKTSSSVRGLHFSPNVGGQYNRYNPINVVILRALQL